MAENTMKEKLSALMDGELDQDDMQQSIRELRSDSECRNCWDQYHVIGDALRNNLPPALNKSFAASVSQAIAAEDVPAPVSSEAITPAVPKPAPQAVDNKAAHPVAKPWMGFAVAASVAAMAYVGVGMINVEEQGPRLASVPTPAATVAVAPTTPVTGSIQTVNAQQQNLAQPAAESKLKTYLYSHRDLAGAAPINTQVIPHARLVSGQAVIRGE